jgi:hypothetical protein
VAAPPRRQKQVGAKAKSLSLQKSRLSTSYAAPSFGPAELQKIAEVILPSN